MNKTYKSIVTGRGAKPRSKRLQGLGTAVSGGSIVLVSTASGENGGNARLTQDILTDISVGHIGAGLMLEAGMSFTQVVKKMFCESTAATLTGKLSTPNDVEYGTPKGNITYTANRNSSGAMKQAYMDDDKTKTLLFSEETDGVQIAIRTLEGIYTQSETYKATAVYEAGADDIPETKAECKISVNVRRKWFAGVVSSVPTTSEEVRALSANGLYTDAGSYKFTISNYRTFVICIPSGTIKEVSLERYQYNFMDLDSAATPRRISVEGANGSAAVEYTMYVFSTETTSTETDNFTFKTN